MESKRRSLVSPELHQSFFDSVARAVGELVGRKIADGFKDANLRSNRQRQTVIHRSVIVLEMFELMSELDLHLCILMHASCFGLSRRAQHWVRSGGGSFRGLRAQHPDSVRGQSVSRMSSATKCRQWRTVCQRRKRRKEDAILSASNRHGLKQRAMAGRTDCKTDNNDGATTFG